MAVNVTHKLNLETFRPTVPNLSDFKSECHQASSIRWNVKKNNFFKIGLKIVIIT